MLKTFFLQLSIILIYASFWFIIAILRKKNDVADIAWGGGFICAAITAFAYQGVFESRALVALALVLLWGIRLIIHISFKNIGKPEDPRYQNWRKEWGDRFLQRTYLQVFLLQGLLLVIISLPVTKMLITSGPPINLVDFLGIAVWFVGFIFEAVGDFQLLIFKQQPENKGKIMKSGLWSYTRHPNYFGEVTLWWGIFLIALSTPASSWTIVGPLTLTYLILKVSGIPMLEKRYENNSEYEDYRRRTSSFLPLPPEK